MLWRACPCPRQCSFRGADAVGPRRSGRPDRSRPCRPLPAFLSRTPARPWPALAAVALVLALAPRVPPCGPRIASAAAGTGGKLAVRARARAVALRRRRAGRRDCPGDTPGSLGSGHRSPSGASCSSLCLQRPRLSIPLGRPLRLPRARLPAHARRRAALRLGRLATARAAPSPTWPGCSARRRRRSAGLDNGGSITPCTLDYGAALPACATWWAGRTRPGRRPQHDLGQGQLRLTPRSTATGTACPPTRQEQACA